MNKYIWRHIQVRFGNINGSENHFEVKRKHITIVYKLQIEMKKESISVLTTNIPFYNWFKYPCDMKTLHTFYLIFQCDIYSVAWRYKVTTTIEGIGGRSLTLVLQLFSGDRGSADRRWRERGWAQRRAWLSWSRSRTWRRLPWGSRVSPTSCTPSRNVWGGSGWTTCCDWSYVTGITGLRRCALPAQAT